MIFSKKCDIIPLGKSHKSLEMQKNLVQNSGTRWYFSCIVYIFSADDIFRKVAENPEKSTILANILRYLQIYIPAGPHWGGRGRKFKSCHSDQNRRFNRTSDFSLFYGLFRAFWCLHRLENVRYFFAKNRLKIGYDHMFDHICHEKAIFHKGFGHFSIFILCKMTAAL